MFFSVCSTVIIQVVLKEQILADDGSEDSMTIKKSPSALNTQMGRVARDFYLSFSRSVVVSEPQPRHV